MSYCDHIVVVAHTCSVQHGVQIPITTKSAQPCCVLCVCVASRAQPWSAPPDPKPKTLGLPHRLVACAFSFGFLTTLRSTELRLNLQSTLYGVHAACTPYL